MKNPRMLYVLGGFVGLTALVIGLLSVNRSALINWQIERGVQEGVASQEVSPTRFELIFCGTGTPQFFPDRSQPCLGVVAAGKFFLFDAGQNASRQLSATASPFTKLEAVFLTHLHSDHMSGVADVLHSSWLMGRQHDVDVVGPPGTQQLLDGIHQGYSNDIEERQRVLGVEYLETTVNLGQAIEVTIDNEEAVVVYDADGLVVEAFRVDHPDWPYAYGYRISYGGKTVVVSGDTKYTPAIAKHSRGTDMLIHEAVNLDMMEQIASALREFGGPVNPDRLALISEVHTPTLEVARVAQEASVAKLVLTHLIPPIPANFVAEQHYSDGMDEIYEGEIIMARDGMRITLIE
ncbi:MAG: MBL fold metallo-hydrolase [Rhodobiaceae bacterium]|nr:MBL fold metallo-hydrolase [Rhodobiaceae bacterium]